MLILAPPGKPVSSFPDPRREGTGDVVAWGANLHPETLRRAYRMGIFPWPHANMPLPWFCPDPRAVLEFDRLHIPESLEKARRKSSFTITIDTAFAEVIAACATVPRNGQDGTWITPVIQRAYCRLHQRGEAHSVEVWDADGHLVGGLYGVDAGGLFTGESMFHRASNTSKLALLHLIEHLSARGADFIDIQQLTPHMARLGAHEIPRPEFLDRLAAAQQQNRRLFHKE
ncbi:MAG: leucyl/phenylalanyl-tRNA--protein transferase [Armatimonadaceae bacterium]